MYLLETKGTTSSSSRLSTTTCRSTRLKLQRRRVLPTTGARLVPLRRRARRTHSTQTRSSSAPSSMLQDTTESANAHAGSRPTTTRSPKRSFDELEEGGGVEGSGSEYGRAESKRSKGMARDVMGRRAALRREGCEHRQVSQNPIENGFAGRWLSQDKPLRALPYLVSDGIAAGSAKGYCMVSRR